MKRKIFIFMIIIILLMTSSFSLASNTDIPHERLYPRLVDDAYLLTMEEEAELLGKLDRISETQELDIVIVTTETLDGYDSTEFADDFFDYSGYGMGEESSGILFLISMEDRDWAISTTGYGISVFTDAGQKHMMDQILPYLSDGDYYEAFDKFADLSDEFITKAKTDKPYDTGNLPKKPMGIKWILISLAGGALIALGVTGVMKGKLKSVRMQASAASYALADSLNLVGSRDLFLYNTVTKTAKPKKESTSSGSSTHTSSSGRSHGGSSGKF